jgi:hypothetical protein
MGKNILELFKHFTIFSLQNGMIEVKEFFELFYSLRKFKNTTSYHTVDDFLREK